MNNKATSLRVMQMMYATRKLKKHKRSCNFNEHHTDIITNFPNWKKSYLVIVFLDTEFLVTFKYKCCTLYTHKTKCQQFFVDFKKYCLRQGGSLLPQSASTQNIFGAPPLLSQNSFDPNIFLTSNIFDSPNWYPTQKKFYFKKKFCSE